MVLLIVMAVLVVQENNITLMAITTIGAAVVAALRMQPMPETVGLAVEAAAELIPVALEEPEEVLQKILEVREQAIPLKVVMEVLTLVAVVVAASLRIHGEVAVMVVQV
jgi:hypothetical protein